MKLFSHKYSVFYGEWQVTISARNMLPDHPNTGLLSSSHYKLGTRASRLAHAFSQRFESEASLD